MVILPKFRSTRGLMTEHRTAVVSEALSQGPGTVINCLSGALNPYSLSSRPRALTNRASCSLNDNAAIDRAEYLSIKNFLKFHATDLGRLEL